MSNHVKILIEGDYINSFVYSGVLFLINSDLILKAYSWDRIFDYSISEIKLFHKNRLKDYSKGNVLTIPEELKKTYSISIEKLSELELCSKELLVWPSDINIYKNRFYVASEYGVDALDFDWSNGAISKFSTANRIFDQMSFKLATNSYYRLAIAAGKSGVISVIPDKKYVKRSNVNQIIDEACADCQWQNNSLIANTDNGQYMASFLGIPKKIDFYGIDSEYWAKVKEIKKSPPKINTSSTIHGNKIVSSWFAGNKIFKVTENKKLYLHELNKPQEYEEVELGAELSTLQYFRAQSSPFGTIMEIGDNLKFFTGSEYKTIDDEVVNWRLFPKSTNYLNHLHVIKDDFLSVSLFDMPSQAQENKFGYPKQIKLED
ncbi:MAG: hypothetical protein V7731_10015 [Amphritea sp.]